MKVTFSSTVGDDIYVVVTGDYDRPDASVGYGGSCQIETVCLPDSEVDIASLISKKQLDRIELEGMAAAEQKKLDSAYEAAEERYEQSQEDA